MQPRYIGHTAPHTAFCCGEQVPDVAIPHYKDARMQHSPMQCPSYTAHRVGNLCGLSRSRSAQSPVRLREPTTLPLHSLRQQTWLQRASRQLQGQGERETKDVLVLYVMYGAVNEVWCRPCPTNLQSPTHHLHDTSTLLLLCPMQPRYIGHTAPHTAFGCGEQVPDVALPHYKDAKMQHSQSR